MQPHASSAAHRPQDRDTNMCDLAQAKRRSFMHRQGLLFLTAFGVNHGNWTADAKLFGAVYDEGR